MRELGAPHVELVPHCLLCELTGERLGAHAGARRVLPLTAADHEEDALLADDRSMFNARVSSRTEAAPGAPLRLAVEPASLYFFDPDTGASLTPGAAVPAAVA